MTVLPWSFLGLDEGFACEAIQLRLGGEGHLDHLEHGRVTTTDQIDPRTYKGVQGSIFDDEIFGALAEGFEDLADFRAKAQAERAACPADDEPTSPHPRRDRFGRIELCEPFVHPLLLLRGAAWLQRETGVPLTSIRELIAHERHVVVDSEPGETGATAIRSLLRKCGHELDPLIRTIYVIPAQLRPIVPLGRGRFESSDLNDLYRRVVNRNRRLQQLHEWNAPPIIVQSERVELQSAIEQLFDNPACRNPVIGPKKRRLESLWDFAGAAALAERLRGLDRWVAERGYAALERGLPWALFRSWRALQAMGLELGTQTLERRPV